MDGAAANGSAMSSSNFNFLESHDARLVHLGALAERYFADDPSTTLFKLRQLAELMAPESAQAGQRSQRGYAQG